MSISSQLETERSLSVAPRSYNPNIALAIIVTCTLMLLIDATVVNIALPQIQRDLKFTTTDLSWIVNAYTLTFGGLLLLGGKAGDIFGRRRVFMAGIAVFTFASFLGGLSLSPSWMLIARMVQGMGAAFAGPNTLAFIATMFAEGAPRNKALSIYSAVSGAGASIGLILGGLLIGSLSWRWVFFVNVPIGIAVLLLTPRFVQTPERHDGQLDVSGAVLATIGTTALVYGFIRAASNGWSDPMTLMAWLLALVTLALFIVLESRLAQPLLPLHLFADRNRAFAYLCLLLLPAAFFGMFFFMSQFLQEVLDFGPLATGLAFLPWTLMMFVMARFTPRLLAQFGAKPLLITGAIFLNVSLLWLSRLTFTSNYWANIFVPMLLMGIGVGFTVLPLNTLILAGVQRREVGAAAGVLQTMMQLGGTLGLAILVTVFGNVSRDAARHPLAHASMQLQAHHVLAQGIATSFVAASCFALLELAIIIFALTSPRYLTPSRRDVR